MSFDVSKREGIALWAVGAPGTASVIARRIGGDNTPTGAFGKLAAIYEVQLANNQVSSLTRITAAGVFICPL
jgi:hypothetical protein